MLLNYNLVFLSPFCSKYQQKLIESRSRRSIFWHNGAMGVLYRERMAQIGDIVVALQDDLIAFVEQSPKSASQKAWKGWKRRKKR